MAQKSKIVELRTRKIAEHNDLITSVAKMDKTPLKIFELAVACIDTENPPKDNIVYLSKAELYSYFDVSDTNKHTRFKEAITRMQEQAFFDIKQEEENGDITFMSIVPIPFVQWKNNDDSVQIEFNKRIMPYLINMKNNFTQYALSDIMDLNSKYAIIIYKWLCMFYNQFEHYEFKNSRTQKQLDEYRNPKIKMRELRVMTDTVKDYARFGNFQTYVLETAIKEINAQTHFNVTYEKIKVGKSIDSIQFHVTKKEHWKDDEYKRDDNKSQLSIEQKAKQSEALYAKAVATPYTTQLIMAGLITAADMANQETIISLSKHVYPLYDELVEQSGKNRLEEHLNYVRDKMRDYTTRKKNIVKYLSNAVRQIIEH